MVILTCVGSTSYALFSYEVYAPGTIHVVFKDTKGPSCVISGPNIAEIGANSTAIYEMSCTDNFNIVEKDLTSGDFTITGNITISSITKQVIEKGYKYIITISSRTTNTTGNIKLKANVLQDISGNYNNESNVSNNVTVVTFPSKPTEYALISNYTSSQTWTAPEDGYFKIELYGASGSGGDGWANHMIHDFTYQKGYTSGSVVTGGGGGGGAYSASQVKLNKGDTVVISLGGSSTVKINSSIESYSTMQAISGGNGTKADDDTDTPGVGGSAGTASGGNILNINGNAGKNGATYSYSISQYHTTGMIVGGDSGGKGATSSSNKGGCGATAKVIVQDGWFVISEDGYYYYESGLPAFVKIYRGNTN